MALEDRARLVRDERVRVPAIVSLARYPTPLFRCDSLGRAGRFLWIKNDGSMGSLYGGNKVRKLERILPLLRERQVSHLVTSGAAGSHFALAVAIFGRQLGYRVSVCLWPQPVTHHVVETLRATVAQGAAVHACRSPLAALGLARRLGKGRSAAGLLPGGLGAAATLAYSDAVAELAEQWTASGEPPPDEHVVACGTGGTVAGILLGCLRHGVPGRVVAVLVSRNPAARALILAEALWAARAQGLRVGAGELSSRLEIDSQHLGRGYGYPAPEGEAALAAGRQVGLALDATYTAKAFSRALEGDDDREISRKKAKLPLGGPRRTVYWHTLSDASPEELLKGAPAVDELRRSYAELFILGEKQS